MTKRFDTEPDNLGDEPEINSLLSKQLEQKIGILEKRIRELETKISVTLNDPAFRNRIDTDTTSWQNNANALGRIAGTLKPQNVDWLTQNLTNRLDDDVS